MISEVEIRERLSSYLTREITLNEFEDWLVLQSWNMHRDSTAAAQRLVGAIELRFAEYSRNHLSDDALERELKGFIAPTLVVEIEDIAPTAPRWVSSTTSESSRMEIRLQAA